MGFLGDFLANKLVAPILLALLILAGAGVAIQTVRINGISVFGRYAVDGYKPLYEAELRNTTTLRANVATLTGGLNSCSASVKGLKQAGEILTRQAQRMIDLANGLQASLNGNIKAVRAVKSTEEKCPVAETILDRAFQ